MALEQDRIKAQSFLDKMKAISDNFNGGNTISAPNGKQNHIGKDGKLLGYWENSSKFVYTNGDDAKLSEYSKNVKDLGFTWIGSAYKALTPSEYSAQSGEMVGCSTPQTGSDNTKSTTPNKSFFSPKNIIIGLVGIGVVLGILKWQKII